MGILRTSIGRALAMGADRVEIEYKDGQELITAFLGNVGFGIGAVDSSKNQALMQELQQLKKTKRLELDRVTHRLQFSEYDSFGEPAYVIKLESTGDTTPFTGAPAVAFDDDLEDDPLDGWEGQCAGCELEGRIDDVGLCAECGAMLERDVIRQRDWSYSVSAFGLTPSAREALRRDVIKQYGAANELILDSKGSTPSPRKRRRRRRRG